MHAAPRPRMSIIAPLLRGNGELHVVGRDDVVTLEDPHGAVHRLVELADGSRTLGDLFAAVVRDHPQLDRQDVADALARLEAAGLCVDCSPRRRERDRRPPALFA